MARSRASAVVPSLVALFVVAVLASPQGQTPPRGTPPAQRPVVSQVVRDRVARNGHARVIVQLRLARGAFALEAALARINGPAAVLAQRQDIANSRARVASQAADAATRMVRSFVTLPLLALEVGPRGLAALVSSRDVERIVPDDLLRPSLETSVPRIEGDQAWQAGYDGTGSAIAILDSGVDATHPFLAGKVVAEACFSSTSFSSLSVCPNGDTTQFGAGAAAPCLLWDCIHGTHVAGIAAGNGAAAGQPFSGVAKGASLIAVQVFSEITDGTQCGGFAPCLGAFESDIIAALEHVYGLKVGGMNVASVNMSLGGGSFSAACDDDPIKPAIDNLRAINVATIVAAGNEGEVAALATPACISSAVSVGATELTDDVAWFSNVAPFLSLFAPGVDIVSSIPGGDYEALSGTSMAAPHVAGAWAILRQAVPAITVDDALAALRNTGQPVTDLRDGAPGTTTVPRIRILKALASLISITSPVPTLDAVTPLTGRVGRPLTLTLTGTGFNALSVVRWNGTEVPAVADSVTQITATVPADLLFLGTSSVVVFNPSPGGGTSAALPVPVLPPPTLTVDQTTVGPGANVTVTLTNGFGGTTDFLALAASGAPDTNYLTSTYVGAGLLTRTWTVKAPTTGGAYEFRLFLNGDFDRAATSPAFTVDPAISPAPVLSSMSATSAVAGSGPVALTLYGSQFVSSSVVNWNGSPRATTFVSSLQLQTTIAASDLTTAGTFPVTVVTPAPGGGTSAALAFTVIPAPVLTVDTTTALAGSNITVTLTNGFGGSQDWLAFAPVGAPDTSYLKYTYVGAGVTTRTWTVTAPATAGTYEFRLYRQGTFVRAATSPAVSVQAVPPALSVSATSVPAGQSVTVTLTNGQGGTQDWLAFAATGAADNAYLQYTYVGAGVTTRTWTVTAPSTSGTYEFRLFSQGTFLRLATSPTVTVTAAPPPSPTLTVNQTSVAPGASVTASLTNGAGGATDYLALAATGAADSSYLQSVLVGSGVTSRTWTVVMPTSPGTYEFRLFVNGVRAATSPTVTVQAPTGPALTVNATTVTSGQSVTVTLTNGQGGAQDWLAFALTSAPNSSYVQFTYVGSGVTTRTWTVTAPATAGNYEFRLFQNGTFIRLATSPTVIVQALPPPTLTVDTTSATPGQSVTVTLTNGLGGSSDWLSLAVTGSPDTSYLKWTYVGAGVTTRTWTVTLPTTPGTYEFRLYKQGSYSRLATSPPITVQAGSQ